MSWDIEFCEEFAEEFSSLPDEVQEEIEALTELLKIYGPQLKRPHVDTLSGSKHKNLKEIRFKAADGVWRVAFAFDPKRTAILLCGGDKSGISEKMFYEKLVEKAVERFDKHLKESQGE